MHMIVLKPLFAAAAVVLIVLGGCAGTQFQPDRSISGPVSVGSADDIGVDEAAQAFLNYMSADSPSERRKWICIAANRDLPLAQSELARLHWPRPDRLGTSPFRQDISKAYIWSLIAIRNGEPLEHMEQRLGGAMSEDERWEATKLAAFWTPDPSECEHLERSKCFSVATVSGSTVPDRVGLRPG